MPVGEITRNLRPKRKFRRNPQTNPEAFESQRRLDAVPKFRIEMDIPYPRDRIISYEPLGKIKNSEYPRRLRIPPLLYW